jgi:MSHA biogenesis protein MshI
MWPFSKRDNTPSNQLLSVSIDGEGISVALALFSPVLDQPTKLPFVISLAEFIPCNDPAHHEFLLNKFVLSHNLQDTSCCFVLNPRDYHLFLLDAPNVQPDEIKQSAKWLIKDLIDYPLDDVAVDVFPSPVREGQKPKIFITAARRGYLGMVSDMFSAAGLKLKKIDIVELAIRNLAALTDEVERGAVVLYMANDSLHITVQRGDNIYLIRRVDNFFKRLSGIDQIKNGQESVSLPEHDPASLQFSQEIMRSIDYYQSQMGQEPPVKILLDWQLGQKQKFINCLREQTDISVEIMSVESLFAFQEGVTDLALEKCFAVIGGCFYLKEQREED